MGGFVRGVTAISLAAVGLVVLAVLLLPRLFGWNAFVVTSGSMSPTFEPGAVVVVAPAEPTSLRNDDIVTFVDASGGYTTHRIVGMKASSLAGEQSFTFQTKGDANEEADPAPLNPQNILGKAEFAVPHLGYIVEFVKTPLGAGLLAALCLFVVFSGGGGHKKRSTDEVPTETSQREAVTVT